MDLYRCLKEAKLSVECAHSVEQDQAEDLVVQSIVRQILWQSILAVVNFVYTFGGMYIVEQVSWFNLIVSLLLFWVLSLKNLYSLGKEH